MAVPRVLRGLKQLIEVGPQSLASQAIEIALWVVTTLALLVALTSIIIGRSWLRSALAAIAAGSVLPALSYLHPPQWLALLLVSSVIVSLLPSPELPIGSRTP